MQTKSRLALTPAPLLLNSDAREKTASSPQPSPPEEEREKTGREHKENVLIQKQGSAFDGEREMLPQDNRAHHLVTAVGSVYNSLSPRSGERAGERGSFPLHRSG